MLCSFTPSPTPLSSYKILEHPIKIFYIDLSFFVTELKTKVLRDFPGCKLIESINN